MNKDVRKLIQLTVVLYIFLVLCVFAFQLAGLFGWLEVSKKQFGGDFVNYWIAANAALTGNITPLFDPVNYGDFVQQFWPASLKLPDPKNLAFSYPPHTALLLTPIGLLPYIPAFFLFTGLSLFAFITAIKTHIAKRLWILIAVIAPAGLVCLISGQNGFFTAALLIGGLSLVDHRPILAGICFRLLTFKPQFGVLLVVALLCQKRWRTIVAGAITTAGLLIGSLILYGTEPWRKFVYDVLPFQEQILTLNIGLFDHMVPSVYKGALNLGASNEIAWMAQIAIILITVTLTIKIFSGKRSIGPLDIAFLCTISLLFTPYVAIYDLVMLSCAALIYGLHLLRQDKLNRRGFYLVLGVCCLPMIHVPLSYLGIPAGPIILLLFSWILYKELTATNLS